jgi:septum site-determining protein MinC
VKDERRKNIFPIKGFKEGLLITLGDGDWDKIQSQLLSQIDKKIKFFNGAKVAIEIGERVLHAAEMAKLRDTLSDRGVKLFAVLSISPVTDANAESMGLKTRKSVLKENTAGFGTAVLDGEPAILLQKTIRSGTCIKYTGHVIVDGDVNPGGEILTTGSIFIWGKLRGSVHAGMDGSEDEVICAMEFDPIKLRIANIVIKNNKLIRKLKRKPVRIMIDNGKLNIEYWENKKR